MVKDRYMRWEGHIHIVCGITGLTKITINTTINFHAYTLYELSLNCRTEPWEMLWAKLVDALSELLSHLTQIIIISGFIEN